MARTITISVNQMDIDRGRRGDSDHCPVAIAASRVLGCVSVGTRSMTFHYGVIRRVPLPIKAVVFINDFDRGVPVRPFYFKLVI